MEAGGGGGGDGWSEAVEDLVDRGDVEGAISVLESVVSRLQTLDGPLLPSGDLRLAAALGDLADLHSSRGFSLKADELRSRAVAIRARGSVPLDISISGGKCADWEAIADRGIHDESLLSSNTGDVGASSSSRKDPEVLVTPKRRGRGSFLYQKSCLYSEQVDAVTLADDNSKLEVESIEGHQHRAEDEAATGGRNCECS
ncbi:hypothetical protein B296_00028015 [Ensete ventricosum]|uniref:Uncharacterized protein n=1 Tax=Ensete ventricosum TaxID=4639 RepID=A0A426Z695_ENSVE|nr:hypothetical protein B296_00028015 [Ensete ventricosum]